MPIKPKTPYLDIHFMSGIIPLIVVLMWRELYQISNNRVKLNKVV